MADSFPSILVKHIGAVSWENQQSAYAKTKARISFAVTAKLISAIVFATRIVQFFFYLNPKFQASSSFLCLYRPVCVGPVRKPHCWFSHEATHKGLCPLKKSIITIPELISDGVIIWMSPHSLLGDLRVVFKFYSIFR